MAEEAVAMETAPASVAEETPNVADEGAPAAEKPAAAEEKPADAEGDKEEPAPKSTAKKPRAQPASAAVPTPGSEGVASGRARRERKQAQDLYKPPEPKKDEFKIEQGAGSKLRDIPNVAFAFSKVSPKDELMENLHNLLYKRKGGATTRKRDVLDFSGFVFAEEAKEKELEARKRSLSNWKLELIHKLMDAFDLQRGSGAKEAKVERVLEFLAEPKQLSDVDLAAKETAKKEKEKAKRARVAAKKEKAKEKKEKEAKRKASGSAKKPAAKKAKKEAAEEEEESESEPESEAEAGSEGEESEPEVMPSGGSRRRGKPAAAKKEEKKEEAEPMETEEKEGGSGGEGEAEEDKAAALSAEQLRAKVEGVLGGVAPDELASVSAKFILQALADKQGYPFKSRKAEIKAIAQEFVMAAIQKQADEEAAAKEGEQKAEEELAAEGKQEGPAAAAAEEEAPAAAAEEEQKEEEAAQAVEAAPAAAVEEQAAAVAEEAA